MTYIEFKAVLTERISALLAEQYEDAELMEKRIYKVNIELDSISVIFNNDREQIKASPVFYVNELYSKYLLGESIEDILLSIKYVLKKEESYPLESTLNLDFSAVKDLIDMEIINYGRNENMLKDVVHKEFLDLAVIYRVKLSNHKGYVASTIVTKGLLEKWKISKEELHEVALKNMQQNNKNVIKNLNQNNNDCLLNLYVLSNVSLCYGAAMMLCSEALKEAADLIGGSFYLLPGSIHELFLVKYEPENETRLKQVVLEANRTVVPLEDWLSDSLYMYDAESEKLIIIK